VGGRRRDVAPTRACHIRDEVPERVDNAGSISRRIVVFDFVRKVSEGDADLGRKLQAEIPSIMLKCNRAYHAMLRAVGADSVWRHLPPYFQRTRAELTEVVNPLAHFMAHGCLVYDPDAYMPLDDWKRAFREHCKNNGFKNMPLHKDKYEQVLFERGLSIDVSRSVRMYPRPSAAAKAGGCGNGGGGGGPLMRATQWLLGVELIQEEWQVDRCGDGAAHTIDGSVVERVI